MPGFVWTIVGALLAALVIGFGFQSALLGVIALGLVGLLLEIIQRLVARRTAGRLVRWELESILIRIRRLRDVNQALTGAFYFLPPNGHGNVPLSYIVEASTKSLPHTARSIESTTSGLGVRTWQRAALLPSTLKGTGSMS